MIVTRLSPTTNGNLHMGHLFTLLVNERIAHQNGGKFYVRFDNTSQAITICMNDEQRKHVPEIIANQRKDIEWLGIEVDGWQIQSEMENDRKLIKSMMHNRDLPIFDPFPARMPYSIRLGAEWQPYPYTPYQTAERTLMDYNLGVTHLIRGDDFPLEYTLYAFFCDLFSFPFPEYILLPRLVDKYGRNISKTNGGYTIAELRGDGYTPQDIIGLVERACLIWPANGWTLYNLKKEPRLEI